MEICVKELCLIDGGTGIRVVIYKSDKKNLFEAFKDYHNNFDSDFILQSEDYFDGDCLDILDYISVETMEDY